MKLYYKCIQCGRFIEDEYRGQMNKTHTCPVCGVENLYWLLHVQKNGRKRK